MSASLARRYRKWNIAEDVDLVVRCEVDGVMEYKGERQLLLIKALNEFDSKSSGAPSSSHVMCSAAVFYLLRHSARKLHQCSNSNQQGEEAVVLLSGEGQS